MWNTFLGKHIRPSSAEVVLALIPSRICNYQFRNHLDSLTLRNTRTVTFKLVAIKNRCSWFTQLYICASYTLFVFVNCCVFICWLSFVIRSVIFVMLFHSHWALFILLLFKRKRTILNLNSVQVFRSYVTCSTSSSRVNKHHTADSTNFVLV